MSFSKSQMIEATRLTREGRLAEATAFIRRSLGLAARPTGERARVVDPPVLEATSSVVSEATPAEPPPAGAQGNEETPAQPKTGHFKTIQPRLTPSLAPLDLSSIADLLPIAELPGKLSPHPSLRKFPAEVVFPPLGRWIAGVYSSEAGTRAYKLYLPSRYQQHQPRPLVVMLHGCTQNAEDFAAGTRMNFLAEQENVLVVYPEQAATANSSRCWNWFQPVDQRRGYGEPALIAGITRQVMADYHVQSDRVYIAGLSAGGAMAAIVAVQYPEMYAALGVHSGPVPGSARDLPSAFQAMQCGGRACLSGMRARAIPLILFHGNSDTTVHPNNAGEFVRLWTGESQSPRETVRQGQSLGGRTYSCSIYQEPSGRTLVELWLVHGASHGWAGGSPNGTFTDPTGPDASGELVRFFREHARTTDSPLNLEP